MNLNDIIMTVLTPGTPFNPEKKIYRTLKTLSAFTGLHHEVLLDALAGDLAHLVVTKPSKKPGVVLVALRAHVKPKPPAEQVPMVKVAGGPIFNGIAMVKNKVKPVQLGGVQAYEGKLQDIKADMDKINAQAAVEAAGEVHIQVAADNQVGYQFAKAEAKALVEKIKQAGMKVIDPNLPDEESEEEDDLPF